jgi:outer membrane protein assembly factor BamB
MSKWRDVVRRAVRWSGLALVIACAAGWQLRPRVGGPFAVVDNSDAKDSPEGVYVPESELAMERLALAQKMERLKEWNKSADLYQEILTDPKYAAKVVPAEGDAEHRLYRSVEELVMQRLAHWPQEGLDVYRGRYETPASAMLQSSRGNDLNVLHDVFSRYFVTEAGKAAAIRLIDRYLESGEFRAAAAIGDRLLQWHPNLGDDRAALFFRTALAYHLVGDDHDAQGHLAELKKRDPLAKGIVRGTQTILADALAKELAQPAPVASGASGDSYTTFGGDVTRNRVVGVSGTPGAHLFSTPLPKTNFGNSQQAASAESHYKEDVKAGLTLGIMPVVDRGELFFQDGQRIYAVDLESGVPLPEWAKTNGPDHGGAFKVPGISDSSRQRQLALSVTDRSVLAVMGSQDANSGRAYVVQPGETRLVCVDRQTGKASWIVQTGQLKQDALRTLQLGGSPLVVGDNVCVVGTAVKQAGFEDAYILCFALDDGSLRWATNIASASTLSSPFGGGFNTGFYLAPNNSHLAYANGRVFVQTNRGAVAAVDVYNGMIDWLATYNRGQQATNPGFNPMFLQQGREMQNQPKPWTYNPVIVSQGLVFTLPIEGKNLLIYDAATGRLVKQIDLQDLGQRLRSDEVEPPNFDTLVGVSGDALVLAAKKSVLVLDWRAFDSAHYNEDKMVLWEEGFRSEVRGRPFLTQNQLYVATEDRMFMVNMKTGVAEKDYPAWPRTWADDEGPGNIVVTSDHAIIAGAEHIDVYTDLAAAKAKLDREVAQSPADPQPRLRYAEVTYAAGDYATSMAKLDEAIERAGGAKLQPGPVRDRIFNDALIFAQKLKNDDSSGGQQRIDALFDRAGQAAFSPEQQVNYRIARAGFDQIKNDPAAAVELYQQILSEPQWRSVSLPDENSKTPASADVIARDRIAQLISHDPSVYSKFEAEAADALQKADQSPDPAKLLAIAQTYPNSSVAAKAMLAAARAYESSGQTRLARHVLMDMYFDRDRRSAERSQVVEALARTDARTAAQVLRQGMAELGDPKLQQPIALPGGSDIAAGTAFSKAADVLHQSRPAASPTTLPSFRLPFPPTQQTDAYPKPFLADSPVIDNVDALVVPIDGFERNDRIVTWSAASLDVYAAGSAKPDVAGVRIQERPAHSAWIGNDALAVWGATQFTLLHEGGKSVAWKLELTQLPSVEVLTPDEPDDAMTAMNNNVVQAQVMVVRGQLIRRPMIIRPAFAAQPRTAGPVGPEQIDQVVPTGEHVLFSTNTGRVVCLDANDGRLAWQVRLSDRPVIRLVANEDFTAVLSETNAYIRLQVLDTFSGHVRGTRPFARATNAYPQNIALSPDGTLVYTRQDRICIKDLFRPWNQREIEHAVPAGPTSFLGMSGPDQLVIAGDRILAITDSGGPERSGEKYVHIYSLETGEPAMVKVADKQQIEQALSCGAKSPGVRLYVAGSRLFTISSNACNAYDLDHVEQHESIFGQEMPLSPISQAMFGKDFLIFVGEDPDAPAPNPPAPPAPAVILPGVVPQPPPASPAPIPPRPAMQLSAFGRYSTTHGEGTRLDYQLKIENASGITPEWQGFDGGLCYRTADRKLHLLLGAKP